VLLPALCGAGVAASAPGWPNSNLVPAAPALVTLAYVMQTSHGVSRPVC
jgi:hypothetical protein